MSVANDSLSQRLSHHCQKQQHSSVEGKDGTRGGEVPACLERDNVSEPFYARALVSAPIWRRSQVQLGEAKPEGEETNGERLRGFELQ